MARQENPRRDVDGARLYLIACCIMSVTMLLSFVAYVLWFGTVRITYFDFVPLPGGHVSNGTMSILFLMLAWMFPALLAKSVCADGRPQIRKLGTHVYRCALTTTAIYSLITAWPIPWRVLGVGVQMLWIPWIEWVIAMMANGAETAMMIGLLA